MLMTQKWRYLRRGWPKKLE